MSEKTFQNKLRQFIRILKQEQKDLIKDDGQAVTEAVSQKEGFLSFFNDYQGAVGQATKDLISTIQELQQTNLLLTQQALAYQQKMMDTIQNSLEKQKAPYGKNPYGNSATQQEKIGPAIVDQAF